MSLGGILRTLGPRLLGAVLGGVATWVGIKSSGAVTIDPEQAATVVTGILAAYSATHRAGSAKINKGDAATGRVAEAENRASERSSTVIIPPPR